MMRNLAPLALALALVLAGPASGSAQGGERDRRERLEEEVRGRFLDMATTRLELTASQKERLATVLEEGAAARRGLMRESMTLRRRLIQAAGDPATPADTFEDLLRRMDALAQREHGLQQREQERLAEFLTPRQRALYVMMRIRFNEQVRDVVRGRRPPR